MVRLITETYKLATKLELSWANYSEMQGKELKRL